MHLIAIVLQAAALAFALGAWGALILFVGPALL